ncbi:MAG: recombination protein RecR [Erysipelotrichaceae bacterium]|nr:recombination protein RecR [Erysipelotrichaceae bacterium]MBO4538379.1 recombination protein RecR [Erysipelotrichaceae bacterium]MBR5049057.1 recombination protein RecR [Erysipelotrichaceae bacterium]
MYPSVLEKLIDYFKMLPSVGQKTAERYAMRMLEIPQEDVENFAHQLLLTREKITRCPVCGNLAEGERCAICADESRDRTTICVVQQPKDVVAMEKMGEYRGLYHVLNGAISPMKGILPDDLNVASLLSRIDENTREIIIATNSTVDGDTTALYITKILKDYPHVAVSRLATGLPMGGNLDYADEVTLSRAMAGRIRQ